MDSPEWMFFFLLLLSESFSKNRFESSQVEEDVENISYFPTKNSNKLYNIIFSQTLSSKEQKRKAPSYAHQREGVNTTGAGRELSQE